MLVVGSGAAGLSVALRLPPTLRVAVVAKRELAEGNTRYAQGGISAVLDQSDSVDSHVRDTLSAGADLCDPQTVRLVVERGPAAIDWLLGQGVQFTRDPPTGTAEYHLTREGGHSHRRVVHAADATGMAVETTLEGLARARANIELLDHHHRLILINRATRIWHEPLSGRLPARLALRRRQDGHAPCVVLATGGASKVYLYTSNPDVSTGDGIAMAWRAGCRVANMEFIQFHPTCLYHPKAKSFLITEAVRGEGGSCCCRTARVSCDASIARRTGATGYRRPRH